ncbi:MULTISPECIES: hypothetical protein [unclassified Kaistella]|uniref:hypothetical protein n=1 Tax=unclassified Kaistella TaxID=2762626 RepID=UPI002733D1C9|nr:MULTISPECIES: hypothetical protein [unclassified Kaistella]MDP2454707.1 hypothetical protein [Kaistella sp. SH11-4b]MDP2457444.1 hypothetical protein [Kaistella sp. SH40-3]MDP2460204.1 hypothetical protein [Kaistella sp. SH19-2b]
MLNSIVNIIEKSSAVVVDGDYLICDYIVEDTSIISLLFTNEYIDNSSVDSIVVGNLIKIEFILSRIFSLGFFLTEESFILKHRYKFPSYPIYIFQQKKYLKDNLPFVNQYKSVIKLVENIITNSKHSYEELNIQNAIILRNESSLYLPLKYSNEDLTYLKTSSIEKLHLFTGLLSSKSFEDKKDAYLNHLVSYLNSIDDDQIRFSFLLKNFERFYDKAQTSYNYYLRQYTYSKFKLELDSKALEFNQKIQAVINDSQTKLIAIPTALVLVLTTLNYEDINSPKNYLAIIGLVIFCIFIQLFINNQKSAINFVQANIKHYKSTFKETELTEMEQSFSKVNEEKNKQIKRLQIIEILLWFIPLLTISVILFLNTLKIISSGMIILYFIISLIIYFQAQK